jgi:hypothetical protein
MTSRNDAPPQQVGEALHLGWTYLRLRCAMCRHIGRIELRKRPEGEGLAQIARLARCSRCGKTGGWVDAKLGMAHRTEKPIAFEGNRTVRVGMN